MKQLTAKQSTDVEMDGSPVCLAGSVVKVSTSRAADPGFDSRGNSSGWNHTSDLKSGIPVAALPGARRYRVSAGTGRPGVSVL